MGYLLIHIIVIVAFLSNKGLTQEIDPDYEKMIERKYDFPVIQPYSLLALLNNEKSIVLLDTREKREFTVSHLPNASFFGYETPNYDLINELDTSQLIVVYCSIGVRSQDVAKELQQRGFNNVFNLYGGIFLWADQFRPMFSSSNDDTDAIHGYNKYWGRWINNAPVVYD